MRASEYSRDIYRGILNIFLDDIEKDVYDTGIKLGSGTLFDYFYHFLFGVGFAVGPVGD